MLQIFNKYQTNIKIFFGIDRYLHPSTQELICAIINVFDLNIEWQKWFAKPKLLLVNTRKNTLHWNSGIQKQVACITTSNLSRKKVEAIQLLTTILIIHRNFLSHYYCFDIWWCIDDYMIILKLMYKCKDTNCFKVI